MARTSGTGPPDAYLVSDIQNSMMQLDAAGSSEEILRLLPGIASRHIDHCYLFIALANTRKTHYTCSALTPEHTFWPKKTTFYFTLNKAQ